MSWAISGRPSAVASGYLPFVEGAGHQRREDEVVDEQVARVLGDGVDRPGPQRLLADRLDVLALAEVAGVGDHVQVVRFVDPLDGDRRVEPAAIRQNHLVACHGLLFLATEPREDGMSHRSTADQCREMSELATDEHR